MANVYLLFCACLGAALEPKAMAFDAFSGTNKYAVSGPSNPLAFDRMVTYVDAGSASSASTCSSAAYDTSSQGVYWVTMAVDLNANSKANVTLQGVKDSWALVKSHTQLPGLDTMQRAGLVVANGSLSLSSDYSTAPPSGGSQPYFSGFRADKLFSPFVGFSVASTNKQTTLGPVTFNKVLLDISGGAWSSATNAFTVPQTGVYVFSMSAGVPKNSNTAVYLYVNGQKRAVTTTNIKNILTTDNVDFVSGLHVASLNSGDQVNVIAENTYSDDQSLQTAFSGFLYNPVHGRQVAWSVSRTTGETNVAWAQIDYQAINVNVGGAWNGVNTVVIPVSGVYYVHIESCTCYTNGQQTYLNRNGAVILSSKNMFTSGVSGARRGQGGIFELAVGDKLWTTANGCIYGYVLPITSFSGFLLYPAV